MKSQMSKLCIIILSMWCVNGAFLQKHTQTPQCMDYCEAMGSELGPQDLDEMCGHEACSGCDKCKRKCAAGWHEMDKKCYTAAPSKADYDTSKKWCADQGANLVSIHSAKENQFVRDKVCGADSCWLGLTEKEGTGDKGTRQNDQKWVWADGSDLRSDSYKNWKRWGGPFDEPQNWGCKGRKCSFGMNDERYTFMNFPHNGNKGKWYDAPKMHQAKAVCDVALGTVLKTPPPSKCPTGWTDFKTSCYIASGTKQDWAASRMWCKSHDNKADLVSINSADENQVVRNVCGARFCWLGLSERPGTGNKDTPQSSQKWVWNDGTDLSKYSNWKLWGGVYNEPNNWGRGRPKGFDERKGFMNWPQAGNRGSWYDAPARARGFAVCEKPQE